MGSVSGACALRISTSMPAAFAAASLPFNMMSIIRFPLCKMSGTFSFWPIRSSR